MNCASTFIGIGRKRYKERARAFTFLGASTFYSSRLPLDLSFLQPGSRDLCCSVLQFLFRFVYACDVINSFGLDARAERHGNGAPKVLRGIHLTILMGVLDEFG